MKRAKDVVAAILKSDAAAVVMGLLLAYGYIRFAIAFIDHMIEVGP